jgi:hypothetical protein
MGHLPVIRYFKMLVNGYSKCIIAFVFPAHIETKLGIIVLEGI